MTSLTVLNRLTMPGRPEQVATARSFVASALGRDHPQAETAVLLTSEVVTNSIVHSASGLDGGTVAITVAEVPGGAGGDLGIVRVEVTDDGAPDLPTLRAAGGGENGYGLRLVNALAERWGYSRDDKGATKTWFEIRW